MEASTSGHSDRSLEVVLLLILGVFMLLFGVLLFSIHKGALPYSPDSMYGLLLVIVAFQMIAMGKTPFGDLRRSWMVIIVGLCVAVVGMCACFIPGSLSDPVRILAGIVLLGGGLVLLFELFVAEGKARAWMKVRGILRQLVIACSLVYVISAVLGFVTLLPGIVGHHQTSLLLLLYGVSFLYLSWCIRNLARIHPGELANLPAAAHRTSGIMALEEKCTLFRTASLPLSPAILILVGVLLVVLGLLLFPVSGGMLPFSPDGQLGLLLVITAIQMMALGETPLGQFRRSWLLTAIGIGFAGLGVFSCIVPGVLTNVIRLLLGLLNITGGALLLTKQSVSLLHARRHPPAASVYIPPILKRMHLAQTVLYVVSIGFGLSMLIPGLVSGMLIAGIVVINGFLLFVLASMVQKLAVNPA